MHDQSHAFDLDTVVADVEDPPSVSRARADGALTMQVLQGGTYHRRTPDLATTACGERIHSQFSPLRREELSDPLCRSCFTEFERNKAAEKTRNERHGT